MAKLLIHKKYAEIYSGYKTNEIVSCQVIFKEESVNSSYIYGILNLPYKVGKDMNILVLCQQYNQSGYWTILKELITLNKLQITIISEIHRAFPELRLKEFNINKVYGKKS